MFMSKDSKNESKNDCYKESEVLRQLREEQSKEQELEYELAYNTYDCSLYFPEVYRFLFNLEDKGLIMDKNESRRRISGTAIQNQFQTSDLGLRICHAALRDITEEDIYKLADQLIQLKHDMDVRELMMSQLKDVKARITELKDKLNIR